MIQRCVLCFAVIGWSFGSLFAQTDTLRLLFAGDIMGHIPQIKSAEVVPGKKWDYTPCFKYIKPLLEKADLAIGNLELTLPGKAPYTGYPMFRSPDALAHALKDAGFDLLVTANNHSNDAHGLGVANTVKTLRTVGFQQTGTFTDAKDKGTRYPLIVYKNNFKIAFLNYTYDTNGVPTQAPTLVNLIDTAQMADDLREARARKPHYIIAVMHWGIEYQLKENAEQRRLARFLIRNGADMIIGAHPHVVQPLRMESATLPDGIRKEVMVVYSLGNFIGQNELVPKIPADGYERFRADPDLTPGQVYQKRVNNDQIGFPSDPRYWESVLPVLTYEAGALRGIELIPISLGWKEARHKRGRPRLAQGEEGRAGEGIGHERHGAGLSQAAADNPPHDTG